eukprot:COSAG02_NODE_2116_length_9799_cov_3.886495_5_plen_662_part_00
MFWYGCEFAGFAYRRDKRLFLRSYGVLLGQNNPYSCADAGDSDSEEDEVSDDVVDHSINDLMLAVLNVSTDEYEIGNNLVFVRESKIMTTLDQLLSAHFDDGAALAEALRAADKEDDVFCYDVFALMAAALDGGGGNLEDAREILADRLGLSMLSYKHFEKVLLQIAGKRALDLGGFVRSISALGVLRVALERMVAHGVQIIKLDLSDCCLPEGSYTSAAWAECLKVMRGVEIDEITITGLSPAAVLVLADQLIGRVASSGNIAAESLQKLCVNSTGIGEPTKYTYSLYTANAAIRSLDLRGVGLGDADCVLISTWLQRSSCKPVATICVADNPHIGYDGSRSLFAVEQTQRVAILGFKHQFAAQMRVNAVANAERSIEQASEPTGAISRMRAVRGDLITYDLIQECARLDVRIEQAVLDANTALTNALGGSFEAAYQCLDVYSVDRRYLPICSDSLEHRCQELENAQTLKQIIGLPKLYSPPIKKQHITALPVPERTQLCLRGPGTGSYFQASSLLENSWLDRCEYEFVSVTSVQDIINRKLQDRYTLYLSTHAGEQQHVFYGSNDEAAMDRIVNHGFGELPRQEQSLTQGLVLEILANKAHNQASIEMSTLAAGVHSSTLMLCKVAKGNCLRIRGERANDGIPIAEMVYQLKPIVSTLV